MSDHLSSRDIIIEAAAELIRTHGVAGMSISRLIKASGTSTGAIYHYFSSKEDIVVEVARQAIAWPTGALEAWRGAPASPSALATYAMDAVSAAPEIGALLAQLAAASATDDALGRRLRAEFAVLGRARDATVSAWAAEHGIPAEAVAGHGQLMSGLTLGYISQKLLVAGFDEVRYRTEAAAVLEVKIPQDGEIP